MSFCTNPIVAATSAVIAPTIAISGIFPFAGFWSKDEILMTAFHNNIALWIVGSVASILTAFYMFRLMYLTFFKEFRGTEKQKSHLHESPALITFPLVILAILAAIGGLISLPGNSWLNHYLTPILPKLGEEHHVLGNTDYILMAIATVGALVGIFIAYRKYISQNQVPTQDSEITGFANVLYNKYYIDEGYNAVFVKPINIVSKIFKNNIEPALSGLVFGLGGSANYLSKQGRKLQNGNIGLYLFVFVLGVSAILIYLFLAQ